MVHKPIESLTPDDLSIHAVWEYVEREEEFPETVVRPVLRIPVGSLTGRVVGSQVQLANGERVWGLLGNIDCMNARLTEHSLTLSIYREGRWFSMARYHDVDAARNGPQALARFIGLPTEDVFPVTYDVTRLVKAGDAAALKGAVLMEPRERLTRAEIIALAVP